MSDPIPLQFPSKPRHYIVVVHGIGDQKINQTLPPVVHRFAEVRHGIKSKCYNILLPATLSSHSVRSETDMHGWSEFRGIPAEDKESFEGFDGTAPTETAGENFRFVELYWQDILIRHQGRFASKTEDWANAMLVRLNDSAITPQDWLPAWALPMLESIVNVAVPLKNMLAFRYTDVTKHIFDDFLGDVHLYGDYARTRGEAVRHFHAALDKIVFYDFLDWRKRELAVAKINSETLSSSEYLKPRITIIAHSLGSIMSFDALVYAFVKDEIRDATAESAEYASSFPFLGYSSPTEEEKSCWKKHSERYKSFVSEIESYLTDFRGKEDYWQNFLKGFCDEQHESENCFSFSEPGKAPVFRFNHDAMPEKPLLLWKNSVSHFITLGSPIDKYITMWHQNYIHLGLKIKDFTSPARWINSGIDKNYAYPDTKIQHYNFCDEQDPVGHHLDFARKTDVYGKIFDMEDGAKRDVVFRRYGIPGVAHNKYWEDRELFKGILREIIDRKEPGTSSYFAERHFREKKNAARQGFLWAYFRVPFLTAIVTGSLLSLALYAFCGSPEKSPLTGITLFLAAILLWIVPSFLTFYKKRSDVVSMEKATINIFFKNAFSPGIFPRLVRAAVEWRRILVAENEGKNIDNIDSDMRLAFQRERKPFVWSPFVWRWAWRFVLTSALIAGVYFLPLKHDILFFVNIVCFLGDNSCAFGFFGNPGGDQELMNMIMLVRFVLIFLLVYLLVLLLVFYEFFRSRRILHLRTRRFD